MRTAVKPHSYQNHEWFSRFFFSANTWTFFRSGTKGWQEKNNNKQERRRRLSRGCTKYKSPVTPSFSAAVSGHAKSSAAACRFSSSSSSFHLSVSRLSTPFFSFCILFFICVSKAPPRDYIGKVDKFQSCPFFHLAQSDVTNILTFKWGCLLLVLYGYLWFLPLGQHCMLWMFPLCQCMRQLYLYDNIWHFDKSFLSLSSKKKKKLSSFNKYFQFFLKKKNLIPQFIS